jgi:hypothetical protein
MPHKLEKQQKTSSLASFISQQVLYVYQDFQTSKVDLNKVL